MRRAIWSWWHQACCCIFARNVWTCPMMAWFERHRDTMEMLESKADFSISVSVFPEFLLRSRIFPLIIHFHLRMLIGPNLCYKEFGPRCGTEVTTFVVFVYISRNHRLCCNTNNTSLHQKCRQPLRFDKSVFASDYISHFLCSIQVTGVRICIVIKVSAQSSSPVDRL